jgi:starvation-inducible DNA-binding protein
MSDLGQSLKVVLADTWSLMMNTLVCHWNVEGPDFSAYHKFYDKMYKELFDAIDEIAEHIRTLDEYVPCSYGRYTELTTIDQITKIPTATNMFDTLLADNDKVLVGIKKAIEQAKLANNEGMVNFLGGRQEAHDKHGWMLRASTKKNRA